MSARVLGVIPARLGSTRLPRKPLHLLAGRPLVEWVWRRAVGTGLLDRVVVATDSEEIAEIARGFGAEAALTSPEHPSGTDRVAELARSRGYGDFPLVVNIQGDEPFVRPDDIAAVVRLVRDQGWEIGTVACRLGSLAEWRDPAVVKVVRGSDGGALLFSRAAIPHVRDRDPSVEELGGGAFLRHLGIYGYRSEALQRWVGLEEGELERLERLEQLRPLAAGMRIGVALVEDALGGVDTPADAVAAERRLRTEIQRA
jgi:3-deoxy-manno-octulosonate cytidylyltransferase (CMP-KDO synthetase)